VKLEDQDKEEFCSCRKANEVPRSGKDEEKEAHRDVLTVATFFYSFFYKKKPLYKYKKMRG
jgi:hypothetical protein